MPLAASGGQDGLWYDLVVRHVVGEPSAEPVLPLLAAASALSCGGCSRAIGVVARHVRHLGRPQGCGAGGWASISSILGGAPLVRRTGRPGKSADLLPRRQAGDGVDRQPGARNSASPAGSDGTTLSCRRLGQHFTIDVIGFRQASGTESRPWAAYGTSTRTAATVPAVDDHQPRVAGPQRLDPAE